MDYRTLGSSDLRISEISLGSWLTFSGGVSRERTEACTRAAFDAGINFFDTANVYGRGAAEQAWGEILSDYPRGSYILATKLFWPMADDHTGGLSAAEVFAQIDASLARLRTDHVDLYQCHRFDPETPICRCGPSKPLAVVHTPTNGPLRRSSVPEPSRSTRSAICSSSDSAPCGSSGWGPPSLRMRSAFARARARRSMPP